MAPWGPEIPDGSPGVEWKEDHVNRELMWWSDIPVVNFDSQGARYERERDSKVGLLGQQGAP